VIAYCPTCLVPRHAYDDVEGVLRCSYGHEIPRPAATVPKRDRDARGAIARAWAADLEATHPGTRAVLLGESEEPPEGALGVVEFPAQDRRPPASVGRDEDRVERLGDVPPPPVDRK
jgi:hypothetical protein